MPWLIDAESLSITPVGPRSAFGSSFAELKDYGERSEGLRTAQELESKRVGTGISNGIEDFTLEGLLELKQSRVSVDASFGQKSMAQLREYEAGRSKQNSLQSLRRTRSEELWCWISKL